MIRDFFAFLDEHPSVIKDLRARGDVPWEIIIPLVMELFKAWLETRKPKT